MRKFLGVVLLAFSTCTSAPVDECAAQCTGCCAAGQCLDGTALGACGIYGDLCDTCVDGQVCESGRCHFSTSGGGTGGGSSSGGGAEVTGGGNGGSSATGGGTGCSPTNCAAQGKNCDSIPNGCGVNEYCGSCQSPATCGGGGVANVCGAPPMVFVQFLYTKVANTSFPTNKCPPDFTYSTCSNASQMKKSQFDDDRLVYVTCAVTQTATDGYTIDCTNNCRTETSSCQLGSGNYQDYQFPTCTPPQGAGSIGCYWVPPP